MHFNNLIFFFLIGVCIIELNEARRLCNCGLTSGGSNACSCQQILVRPPKQQKIQFQSEPKTICARIPGITKLTPIGDSCTCKDHYVRPAYVPKQTCNTCAESNAQKLQSFQQMMNQASSQAEEYYEEGSRYSPYQAEKQSTASNFDGEFGNYENEEQVQTGLIPADAVSLTLAYDMAKRAKVAVREEGLQFGPKTIPKDGRVIKKENNIAEEKLGTFDKQVVELRFPTSNYRSTNEQIEAEAEEALLAAQEEELDAQEAGYKRIYPTYQEIGYSLEKPKTGAEFMIKRQQYEEPATCSDLYPNGQGPIQSSMRAASNPLTGVIIRQDDGTEEQQEVYEEEQSGENYGASGEEQRPLGSGYSVISSSGPQTSASNAFLNKLVGCGCNN